MVLRIESGDAQVSGERWHNCLLLAADMDPFALVERAVAAAAAMSGRPYIIACRMPTIRHCGTNRDRHQITPINRHCMQLALIPMPCFSIKITGIQRAEGVKEPIRETALSSLNLPS